MGRGRHGALGRKKGWERWWRTDKGAEDVRYVQFMGKDNVAFHNRCLSPRRSSARASPGSSWITSSRSTTSTTMAVSSRPSQGRGVFMDQALEILPPDYWRWWLLSHAPGTSDAEFNLGRVPADVNKDLADVLGNFVKPDHEVLPLEIRRGGAGGRGLRTAGGGADRRPGGAVEALRGAYGRDRDPQGKRPSCGRSGWRANEYLQSAAPWTAFKERPPSGRRRSRAFALNLIPFYAGAVGPFSSPMPQRRWPGRWAWRQPGPTSAEAALSALPGGHAFTVPDVMFAKIADETRGGMGGPLRRNARLTPRRGVRRGSAFGPAPRPRWQPLRGAVGVPDPRYAGQQQRSGRGGLCPRPFRDSPGVVLAKMKRKKPAWWGNETPCPRAMSRWQPASFHLTGRACPPSVAAPALRSSSWPIQLPPEAPAVCRHDGRDKGGGRGGGGRGEGGGEEGGGEGGEGGRGERGGREKQEGERERRQRERGREGKKGREGKEEGEEEGEKGREGERGGGGAERVGEWEGSRRKREERGRKGERGREGRRGGGGGGRAATRPHAPSARRSGPAGARRRAPPGRGRRPRNTRQDRSTAPGFQDATGGRARP